MPDWVRILLSVEALLLTGPPASGKNTVAAVLVSKLPTCAIVDVDDVRWFVRKPHIAPWEPGGETQVELGVGIAIDAAKSLAGGGFFVVLLDVVSETTLATYRDRLPDLAVVKLLPPLEVCVARNAARSGGSRLEDERVRVLHAQQNLLQGVGLTVGDPVRSPEEVAGTISSWLDHI